MENSITRIADLPTNGASNGSSALQTISISESKKKTDEGLPTNYKPINVHPNPYGISEQNPIAPNPEVERVAKQTHSMDGFQSQHQTGGLPEEYREQIQNMSSQQLPSRDIPMHTEGYNIDERVQPNHIPSAKAHNDYVREHHDMTEQNLREYEQKRYRENTLDSFLNDIQTPIFVAILYFFFQLPMVNTFIFKKFSFLSIYSDDGNFNFYGLVLKSLLFGNIFYTINKAIGFITTL
jgi:hypothetical protein|tara:strand:+ start:2142 stop:2852 length:711 start_codon:yes stop_codon:yes gene_type:complete